MRYLVQIFTKFKTVKQLLFLIGKVFVLMIVRGQLTIILETLKWQNGLHLICNKNNKMQWNSVYNFKW
jgi:hypothetical protein